jgi:hypothetical protein
MSARNCAYCGSEAGSTREHLWPKGLHLRLVRANNAEELFWLARIGQEIKGQPTIKDVCAACNNGTLSELDNYMCELFDRYFIHILKRHQKIRFQHDYHRLKRWLLKISFNSARIHNSIDCFVYPPLLPYISGKSEDAGRSVQLYAQLSYPGEVPESELAEDALRPLIFQPTMNRVGHMWFTAHGVGKKLLRAVHLRSYSFYLAFFEPEETSSVLLGFSNEFLSRMAETVLLRPSIGIAELVCNGTDAWVSFAQSREAQLVARIPPR